MALDLSVKTLTNFVGPRRIGNSSSAEEESSSNSSDSAEDETYGNNDNSMTALNLSLPKLLDYEEDDDEDEEEEDQEGRHSNSQLTSQQLQLDIAALNLMCLARLQETAAVLAGRRPMPAHMNSSSTTYPLVSSSALNRRTHRCDEPGCDKVH
jgi:hypothetical protein